MRLGRRRSLGKIAHLLRLDVRFDLAESPFPFCVLLGVGGRRFIFVEHVALLMQGGSADGCSV